MLYRIIIYINTNNLPPKKWIFSFFAEAHSGTPHPSHERINCEGACEKKAALRTPPPPSYVTPPKGHIQHGLHQHHETPPPRRLPRPLTVGCGQPRWPPLQEDGVDDGQ